VASDAWTAVDRYFEDRLIGSDPALEAALQASAKAGLPEIAVSPSQGKLLQILAASIGAKRILEVGTLGGYSAIWLARALPEGGRLISIEADPRHAEVARGNLAKAGVAKLVDIWIGEAMELLPKVAAAGIGPFDFAFIDADKANIPDYVDWTVKMSRPGALVVVDNVVRNGRVLDATSGDPDIAGVRRFHDMLASDERLTATSIQTVGVKGYDGFTLAMVKG
jgi:predicted O-methyltransferase YrrM